MKFFSKYFVLLFCVGISGVTQGNSAIEPYFVSATFEVPDSTITIPYRLHLPSQFDIAKKYPLIVWLHGEGESGSDNRLQLRHLDTTLLIPERRGNCDFLILVPQKPKKVSWIGDSVPNSESEGSPYDMLEVVTKLLDHTIAQYPVDEARVAVLGLSSGGTAAWELAARSPERYSALLPFSAAPKGGTDLNALLRVPVWAFYPPTDYLAPPDATQNAVSHLQQLGGYAAFTFSNDEPEKAVTHYCWKSAFRDYDLYTWLLAQERDGDHVPRPGRHQLGYYLRWDYFRPVAVRLAVVLSVLACFLACVKEIRRRSYFGGHSK
jgi:predicted peptidase